MKFKVCFPTTQKSLGAGRLAGTNSVVGCKIAFAVLAICCLLGSGLRSYAQTSDLPFTVSNPKHKNWPIEEARRIYFAACDRVARAVRPEKPPTLLPKFVLVLGSDGNTAFRVGDVSEIRLKDWNPDAFSEAVVIMAARSILDPRELASLGREALVSAQASVSVSELRSK